MDSVSGVVGCEVRGIGWHFALVFRVEVPASVLNEGVAFEALLHFAVYENPDSSGINKLGTSSGWVFDE